MIENAFHEKDKGLCGLPCATIVFEQRWAFWDFLKASQLREDEFLDKLSYICIHASLPELIVLIAKTGNLCINIDPVVRLGAYRVCGIDGGLDDGKSSLDGGPTTFEFMVKRTTIRGARDGGLDGEGGTTDGDCGVDQRWGACRGGRGRRRHFSFVSFFL